MTYTEMLCRLRQGENMEYYELAPDRKTIRYKPQSNCAFFECLNPGIYPQHGADNAVICHWCTDHKVLIETMLAVYGNVFIYIDPKTKRIWIVNPSRVSVKRHKDKTIHYVVLFEDRREYIVERDMKRLDYK